jgi:hypothetical protein
MHMHQNIYSAGSRRERIVQIPFSIVLLHRLSAMHRKKYVGPALGTVGIQSSLEG